MVHEGLKMKKSYTDALTKESVERRQAGEVAGVTRFFLYPILKETRILLYIRWSH